MSKTSRQHCLRPWIGATGIFLICAVVAAGLPWRLGQPELAETRAADLATDQAQSLRRGIERAMPATYAIAEPVRQSQGNVLVFAAIKTRDSEKFTLARRPKLVQSGLESVGHLPIFLTANQERGELWGFTSVTQGLFETVV